VFSSFFATRHKTAASRVAVEIESASADLELNDMMPTLRDAHQAFVKAITALQVVGTKTGDTHIVTHLRKRVSRTSPSPSPISRGDRYLFRVVVRRGHPVDTFKELYNSLMFPLGSIREQCSATLILELFIRSFLKQQLRCRLVSPSPSKPK
jgi:hypothetical protein